MFTVLHNDPAVPTVQYKCGRYRIQTRDQVHRNESLNNSGAPEAWNYWQKVSVLFISIFCLSYLVKKEKNTHCTLAIAFKELWDHLCCLYFYYSKIPILLDYNINITLLTLPGLEAAVHYRAGGGAGLLRSGLAALRVHGKHCVQYHVDTTCSCDAILYFFRITELTNLHF